MSWILTNKDLYLLTKMLGGKLLVGMSNPFLSYSEQEMEKEWENTFTKLYDMDLADFIDGELIFNEAFIQAIWVVAKSNMVTEILTDQSEQSLFFHSDERVIECRRENEEEYSVVDHENPDWSWNTIIIPRMLMGIDNLQVRLKQSLFITPEQYETYCQENRISNKDELLASQVLEDDQLMIKLLDQSIQRKIHTNRLMNFYYDQQQWKVEGVHILSSPAYNWTLRMVEMDGQEMLEVKQAAGQLLIDEILGVVQRVKAPTHAVKI